MGHVRDLILVHGSVAETVARLERFFGSQRGADGIARLRLRVPVDGPLRSLDVYFDREVRVEAWRDPDDQNRNDLIRISWSPEGSVVFPKLVGTLVVRSEDDPGVSYIELDGTYKPPLGAAGQIFDEAIGHRIAQATAREFLKDLKRGVEAQSRP